MTLSGILSDDFVRPCGLNFNLLERIKTIPTHKREKGDRNALLLQVTALNYCYFMAVDIQLQNI